MRLTAVFPISDRPDLKRRLLHWANNHPVTVYLDSNGHTGLRHSSWECLVAAGSEDTLIATSGMAFDQLKALYDCKQDWLFGFLGYDLKNEVEQLSSAHPDGIGMPDLFFFQPTVVAGIRNNCLEIHTLHESPAAIYQQILEAIPGASSSPSPTHVLGTLRRSEYLQLVDVIRNHIMEGDLYEMNLCQEFYEEQVLMDPRATFERLNALGKAPFSAYLRWKDRYLLCASPERFLRKEGDTLVSQPIKGTRRRAQTPAEDEAVRQELAASEKDRAENVMIVDLVRNDLARSCQPGSVQVESLFGIHTFETVHQMISTITGELRPEIHPVDAIRQAFPMGSMTGAPKVMAMQLIEQYERSRRGLYSGAVGYFDPAGNFDFNVVIRSLLYNAQSRYLSFQVGGAIVYDSVPEQEYEECLTKAQLMLRAIGAEIKNQSP